MADKYTELLKKTACYGVVSFSFLLAKETNIFSTLIKANKPLTSLEVAQETHIKDRYAQEILGCLSAVGLVRVASRGDGLNEYHLDNAAKEALSNGCDFALPEMNYVKILMTRYNAVKSIVDTDALGVARYEQSFFDLMQEHRMKLSPEALTRILDNVPELRTKLEKGINMIEFGCGTACTLITLAAMFPNSHFTASDICSENIEALRKKCNHIANMSFDVFDLMTIPETGNSKYDWLYVNDVIHDLPHPLEALKGMKRLMKGADSVCTLVEPGCTGSHSKDAGDIFAAFIYTMSTFCCIPESFQSPNSEAYGLGMGKETLANLCKAAGFETTVVPMQFRKALFIGTLDT